jgi:uncharacterized membrane protein YiaA
MLIASQLFTSAVFGAMLFFSFVMAPLIFTRLDAVIAGKFIRTVFPWYYAVLGILSLLAGLLAASSAPLEAGILLGVASLALFSRQILMPQINRLRDRAGEGDARAEAQFSSLHRLSVAINMVQLVAVTVVLLLLANT